MPEKRQQLVDKTALHLRAAFIGLEKNQTEIADFLDVRPNRINQYVNAKRLADLSLMIRLCERYGLTLDWIYRGDPSGLKASVVDKITKAYDQELVKPTEWNLPKKKPKKSVRHAA